MVQDAPDHRRVLDERDQLEPIPAAGTREDVKPETPLHQLGPGPIRPRPDRHGRGRRPVSRFSRRLRRSLGIDPGEPRPPRGPRTQYAVIQQEVDARPRQGRQPLEQLQWLEHQPRRPICPAMPKIQDHLPLGCQVDPIVGHWRAQGVKIHHEDHEVAATKLAKRKASSWPCSGTTLFVAFVVKSFARSVCRTPRTPRGRCGTNPRPPARRSRSRPGGTLP